MFIQVIHGKMHPPGRAAERLAEAWRDELSGVDAVGWLGGTYGFTDDDQFIGVVRFDVARRRRWRTRPDPETGRLGREDDRR